MTSHSSKKAPQENRDSRQEGVLRSAVVVEQCRIAASQHSSGCIRTPSSSSRSNWSRAISLNAIAEDWPLEAPHHQDRLAPHYDGQALHEIL